MTEDILEVMEERRNFRHNKLRYIELIKEIRRMCRKVKQKYQESLCKEIEELDRKHNQKAYNIIKKLTNKGISGNSNIKDKDGNTLTTEKEIVQRCAEYSHDDTNRPLKIRCEVSQYKKAHIDREKVKSIIESLPTGEATGKDEIPAEL